MLAGGEEAWAQNARNHANEKSLDTLQRKDLDPMRISIRRRIAAALVAGTFLTSGVLTPGLARASDDFHTTTPIKHVVIIFQENASFDHYFATYPNAKNDVGVARGGTPFFPREDTP